MFILARRGRPTLVSARPGHIELTRSFTMMPLVHDSRSRRPYPTANTPRRLHFATSNRRCAHGMSTFTRSTLTARRGRDAALSFISAIWRGAGPHVDAARGRLESSLILMRRGMGDSDRAVPRRLWRYDISPLARRCPPRRYFPSAPGAADADCISPRARHEATWLV